MVSQCLNVKQKQPAKFYPLLSPGLFFLPQIFFQYKVIALSKDLWVCYGHQYYKLQNTYCLCFILVSFNPLCFRMKRVTSWSLWTVYSAQSAVLVTGVIDRWDSLICIDIIIVIQLLSHVCLCVTPCAAAHQDSLSSTIFQSLLKFIFIESWSYATISSSAAPFSILASIFPHIRVFCNELALLIRGPKYWGFSISLSNEYSVLISFRIDWFDILAVEGTFKSLLQHHNLKGSILRHSAFFMVQLSHLYMTTGKTIALAMRAFAGKVVFT